MASQKIKGLTIKLNADTSAINDALSNTNKSLSSTQKELTQVNKLLKFDPKNTTLMAQKQSLLTDAINDTKKKLQELEKVQKLANEDSGVDKASKEYRDLERQIEKAKQEISGFEKEQRGLNGALEEGGKNASNFGDIVKGNLISSAVISGVKALASAVKDVATGLYESVRDAGRFADDVNTMAKQFNMSTKEIQQYIKASDLIDVSVETIAKSMTKLTKNMTTTNKQTLATFDTLGIKLKEENGQLRDSNKVFYETLEALSLIENETQQDAYALDIFGKSASELGPLINGGAEELAKLNKYMEENNLILSQSQLDELNEMNDAFDTLKLTFEGVVQQMMAEIGPTLTPLVDGITKFIKDNIPTFVQIAEDLVAIFTGTDEDGQGGKRLMEELDKLITNVVDFITQDDVIKMFIDAGVKIGKAMAQGISDHINDWWKDLWGVDGDWTYYDSLKNRWQRYNERTGGSGGFGNYQSSGFGSGGYGNITLNASFTNNGNLTEAEAMRYADIMADRINEKLGQMI